MDIAPDGKRAASASSENVKIWSLRSGRELKTLDHRGDPPHDIKFSPDGGLLVLRAEVFKVWETETWGIVTEFNGGDYRGDFAFTFDRRLIAVISEDLGCLTVWDLESPKEPQILKGTDAVRTLVLTPDDEALVTLLTRDPNPRVWNIKTGELLVTMAGHKGEGTCMEESHGWVSAVAVTPDGRRAVVVSYEGSIGIWDLSTGVELSTLKPTEERITALAVAAGEERLICGCSDHTAIVMSLKNSHEFFSLEGHEAIISSVAVTSDGRLAVTGSQDQTVRIWDLVMGKSLRTLKCPCEVWDVALSPDDQTVFSVCDDGAIRAWDMVSGELMHTFRGHSDCVEALAVSPDGKRLVSGSEDDSLSIWDLRTGKKPLVLRTSTVKTIVITRDGQRAITGSSDGAIRFWDLEEGREIPPPEALGRPEMIIVPASSGEPATVAYFDNEWKLRKGNDVKTIWPSLPSGLGKIVGEFEHRALEPGGRWLFTSLRDKITLWDVHTREQLASFSVGSEVESLATSPDGKSIIVGTNSGRVHLLRSAGIANSYLPELFP